MTSLIITAPHSFCHPALPYRNCDRVALLASDHLASYQFNGSVTRYFPANHHRAEIDLNRSVAKNTDYRRKISQALEDAQLLIDIHSAPLHGYEIDADLIILDNHPGTWYGKLLYETLKHQGISVGYLFGANYNDITEEARKKNIPAILLEYAEYLTPEKIKLWLFGLNICYTINFHR